MQPIIQDDIFILDVAVEDALAMEIGDALDNLRDTEIFN
jgi:hypothetical protein